MGKFIVELTEKALKDIALHKKSGDKSSEKKIKKILEELKEHPLYWNRTTRGLKTSITW